MHKLLLLAAGGALGAVLRYAVSGLAHRLLGATFPWGTLVVNVIGCFFIGLLWALSERPSFPPALRIFLLTGTLGAFTTFSTFGLESYNLARDGEFALSLANIVGSNAAGLGAVVAGFFLARFLLSPGGAS